MVKLYLFSLFIFLLNSCVREQVIDDCYPAKEFEILHISHTRTDTNPGLAEYVAELDYSRFDMVWLGGDLAAHSSADTATMMSLDSVFDLGKATTLWTLGNHDGGAKKLIGFFTGRPDVYSQNFHGITIIVLYTNDSLSYITSRQMKLIREVTDTISQSSHLVILHHKLIWMPGDPVLEPMIPLVSNGNLGTCGHCISPNNFWTDVYPVLTEVENRGIEVLCVGGDIGMKTKEFSHETAEGVTFLASGLDFNSDQNMVLRFIYQPCRRKLSWAFDYLENQPVSRKFAPSLRIQSENDHH